MPYEQELSTVVDIVKRVGEFQREQQKKLPKTILKEDRSPVTVVDIASETMIREHLLGAFPLDAFWGEESGTTEGESSRRWIVDPLDGTRPYIRNIPTYSILVALEENGVLVLGVVYFPALDECYWATRGGGAFCNGSKITVSPVPVLAESMGSALGLTEMSDLPVGKSLLLCMQSWDYVYGFMDAYSYMSVASGKLDVCVSLLDMPWDRAPAALIVAEAGGVFSDLSGKPTIYTSGSFLVSNGLVHQETLESFCELSAVEQ